MIDADPLETLGGLLVGGAVAVALMAWQPGPGELAGVVLRPVGGETLAMARNRVLRTLVGAVLAAALVAALPLWSQLVVQTCLLFLLLAYSSLGRYALDVVFVTPFVIFLGGYAEAYTAGVGLQRVIATLAGAVTTWSR